MTAPRLRGVAQRSVGGVGPGVPEAVHTGVGPEVAGGRVPGAAQEGEVVGPRAFPLGAAMRATVRTAAGVGGATSSVAAVGAPCVGSPGLAAAVGTRARAGAAAVGRVPASGVVPRLTTRRPDRSVVGENVGDDQGWSSPTAEIPRFLLLLGTRFVLRLWAAGF